LEIRLIVEYQDTTKQLREMVLVGVSRVIVFRLGDVEYGISTLKVQVIEPYKKPTKIPGAPEYIEGIISLKGDIVVLVNLKIMLCKADCQIEDNSWIVVVNSPDFQVGFTTDSEPKAEDLDTDSILLAPDSSAGAGNSCEGAISRSGKRKVIILDTDELVEKIEI